MKRDLPGTKPSRLLGPPLSAYLPDPRHPAIPDQLFRNQFFKSTLQAEGPSSEPMRVTGATSGGNVPGASVAISVTADGRELIGTTVTADSNGNAYAPAVQQYIIPTSTPISGGSKFVVDIEPFVLAPMAEDVVLRGKDRLRPSKRREAAMLNAGHTVQENKLAATGGRPRLGDRAARQASGLPFPDRVKHVVRDGRGVLIPLQGGPGSKPKG